MEWSTTAILFISVLGTQVPNVMNAEFQNISHQQNAPNIYQQQQFYNGQAQPSPGGMMMQPPVGMMMQPPQPQIGMMTQPPIGMTTQPPGGQQLPQPMMNFNPMQAYVMPGIDLFWMDRILQGMCQIFGQTAYYTTKFDERDIKLSTYKNFNSETKPIVAETLKAVGKEIEVSISAVNLPNADFRSKSDPYCITYIRTLNGNKWMEYHRTETINNQLSPTFAWKPMMPPSFGDKYSVKFEFFDYDPASKTDKPLAHRECNLRELLDSIKTKEYELRKIDKMTKNEVSSKAKLIIRVEELISNYDEIEIELKGTDIEKLDRSILGTKLNSDPYIIIKKHRKDGYVTPYSVVHRTEYIRETETPRWSSFKIPIRNLCNGDEQRPLLFSCFDWDEDGGHDFLGSFETSLAGMRTKFATEGSFELQNPESKRRNKISGNISIVRLDTIEKPNFEKFIRGGLRIHCTFAIDFSEKNGRSRGPESLHFQNPNGTPNKFQQAINSVVGILEDYDWDKNYQVLGFGGSTIREDFNINVDNTPCMQVRGVLDLYQRSLPNITPTTPSSFAPLIQKVAQTVRSISGNNKDDYFILVIFSADIDVNSVPLIKAAIEGASTLPLSIIIVGVGDSSSQFANMDKLDADIASVTGTKRDTVQFVALNKFAGISFGDGTANLNLAKELLAEVPKQVLSYMLARGIKPNPAPQQSYNPQGFPYQGGMLPYNMQQQYNMVPPGMPPSGGYSQASHGPYSTTFPQTTSIQ